MASDNAWRRWVARYAPDLSAEQRRRLLEGPP
jgi:hypothetical protein